MSHELTLMRLTLHADTELIFCSLLYLLNTGATTTKEVLVSHEICRALASQKLYQLYQQCTGMVRRMLPH